MTIVPKLPERQELCICKAECPSYPGIGIFFCAKGRSVMPVKRRGCVCQDCANFQDYGLKDRYYCDLGAAGEHGDQS